MNLKSVIGSAVKPAVLACAALLAAGATIASTASAASVSSNWAGYLASPLPSVAKRFSSVSGSWREPSAVCSAGREGYSAVWVGLGGDREDAQALEQVGTDADCSRSGHASYAAWYELIPAGPVGVPIRVRPGDRMSASVTVRAHDVTLRIRDLSSGARFTATRGVANVDVSSAEWIVEAPSVCFSTGSCGLLPLTDFGSVEFTSATATAAGHTGTIDDADWSATALELRQDAGHVLPGGSRRSLGLSTSLIAAAPSSASPADGSFSVSWNEQSTQAEAPSAPSLPGFNGGPP